MNATDARTDPDARWSLHGRVAVITGAGSGIGEATALTLGRRGASVVLTARDPARLEHTAERVRTLGAAAEVVPADVRDSGALAAVMSSAVDAFGRLDVVFANAGGMRTVAPLAASRRTRSTTSSRSTCEASS